MTGDMGHVVKEEVMHKRYLSVYNREVEFKNPGGGADEGKVPKRIAYDIVGHPKSAFQFVVVVRGRRCMHAL